MNELPQDSIEHALASPARAREALDRAETFTRAHRETGHLPPAEREAVLLDLQFPACWQPPQAGDLLAGRIYYPMVGFSPEAMGLGYYCADDFFERLRADPDSDPETVTRCDAILDYWAQKRSSRRVRAAYPPALAALLPSDAWMEESGVGFPLYRMGGTMLDYRKILEPGLHAFGMERDGSPAMATCRKTVCRLIDNAIRHYVENPGSLPGDSIAELESLLDGRRPRSFHAATQLLWLVALLSGSWNYGRLDVILGPFLDRDLRRGTIDEEGAVELLCSLWRLIHGYNNQYNNRVIVGGMGRADEAVADRFARLAIEATRRVRLNQPQLTLRFHEGQDPRLWERALDAIGEGCTFPMLYNDDVNVPAVARAFDVPESEAVDYLPYGCGEYVLGSQAVNAPNGVINLLKALELALHGGVDPLTGRKVVDAIPPARTFADFEAVWRAYARVVEQFTAALAVTQKIQYDVVGQEAAFSFFSMLLDDCAGRGKTAFAGGVRHLGGALETYGNTNAADSLHVIDELVFRRREVTLPELVEALDANFEGQPDLLARCRVIAKYGNDEATADAMARRVHEHICRVACEQSAPSGLDSWLVVVINNWANTVLGWKTGASAEGRLAGTPMANGNNPSSGADVNGVTAFLNSLVKLDPTVHAGAVQNMKFGKEWFTPEMRPKFDALLKAYFANGGTQAMITVVSKDDLEAAMREPEKWGHLMVRVGGFSIRFVELPTDAQREVLARTLH